MRNRALRLSLFGVTLAALAIGCSSSSTPSSAPADSGAAASLSGIYVTNSRGGIQQFEFLDSSHVNVWWASCAGGLPCEANDTYTWSGDQLVISEPGGNTTKIVLSGIENGVGTSYVPLHPLGGSLTGGTGDASLTTQTDASISGSKTITIVITFTITIVIEGGDASLLSLDSGKKLTSDGGKKLTSDGSVSLLKDGAASDAMEGGTGTSGTGSSGSGGGGNSGSGSGGSGSGTNLTGGSGSGGNGGSDAGSGSDSGSPSSTQSVCQNVTQTFHSANTFPNDKTSFDFLLSEGLNATQAAGVVGNLDQESGDNPVCYQGPSGCSSSPVSGFPGAGIAQWSRGGRWDTDSNDNAKWYATKEGESINSLQLQLQFLWYELSTFSTYGLSSLEGQSSIAGAAQVFASKFEICGTCDQTNRDQYGQNAFNAFSSDQVQSASMDGGSCIQNFGSCSANGSSGNCIDTGSCASLGGTSTAGHCPGPSNIQCCTQ